MTIHSPIPAAEAIALLRKALQSAKYSINGREHTGFIDKALAATSNIEQPQVVEQEPSSAFAYAWKCKAVGDWRIEKLKDGCIAPSGTISLFTHPPKVQVLEQEPVCPIEQDPLMFLKLLVPSVIELADKVNAFTAQQKPPQPKVPDGWKLVPIFATPEMNEVLLMADRFTVAETYIMLLAAAPTPKKTL